MVATGEFEGNPGRALLADPVAQSAESFSVIREAGGGAGGFGVGVEVGLAEVDTDGGRGSRGMWRRGGLIGLHSYPQGTVAVWPGGLAEVLAAWMRLDMAPPFGSD